jgi:pilus assembly protein Flp/PilA
MIGNLEVAAACLRARARDDRGASLIEYALLMALIAIVCVAAVTSLGGATNTRMSSGAGALSN